MKVGKLYRISKDDVIHEGTYKQLCQMLGIEKTYLYRCAKDGTLIGGWRVQKIEYEKYPYFRITNENGKVIMDAPIESVCRKLLIDPHNLKRHANEGTKVYGCSVEQYYKEIQKAKGYMSEVESVIFHLQKYGNTVCVTNPVKFQSEFEANDLKVDVYERKDEDGKYYILEIQSPKSSNRWTQV